MPSMVSYPRRLQSGHITCYLNRTYHVLTTRLSPNLGRPVAVMLGYAPHETSMTANDFRKLALSLPETEERSHMNHPDFRVCGKIFAMLGYPDKSRGMIRLSPEQQHYFSKDYPQAFVPVNGAWGRRGATSVHLKAAKQETLRKAMQ